MSKRLRDELAAIAELEKLASTPVKRKLDVQLCGWERLFVGLLDTFLFPVRERRYGEHFCFRFGRVLAREARRNVERAWLLGESRLLHPDVLWRALMPALLALQALTFQCDFCAAEARVLPPDERPIWCSQYWAEESASGKLACARCTRRCDSCDNVFAPCCHWLMGTRASYHGFGVVDECRDCMVRYR
jgi:hypothetical protein